MLITLSRPGGLPHTTLRTKTRYRSGEVAPIAEGTSFEILRGDVCGAGTLKVSGPPDYQLQDWVRVYLPGDVCNPGQPDDDPSYLGEVTNEPWEAGVGSLTLKPLIERVRKAAWRGPVVGGVVQPLKATLRPYLLDVLARAALGPVTVGDVADVPVGFYSTNPFELLATTLDSVLPALPGGVIGVDARARLQVRAADDVVMHRFARTRSKREPGRVDGYANCVQFKYTRPSGSEATFALRLTLEVAHYGQEAWTQESLPASVTTTLTNPYAALPVRVYSYLTYSGDNAGLTVGRDVSLMAMAPTWAGHLGDGVAWNTGVRSGSTLQLRATGQDAYTFRTVVSLPLTFGPLLAELRLQVELPGNPTQTIGARDGTAAGQPGDPGWTYEPAGLPAGAVVRYHPTDLLAYRAVHGVYPQGFDLSVRASDGGSLRIVRGAAPIMDPTRVVMAENDYVVPASGAAQLVPAPPMQLPMAADLHLPTYYQWRAGDQVTTDAHVTAVTIYDSETRQQFVLARADDDPDTGRRVWTLPGDARADGMMVSGDLRQIGWVGLRVTDETGLAVYAYGLLRNRVQPARSWRGVIRTAGRIHVGGRARFDTPGGDVELDEQKATYNAAEKAWVVECGTPWPSDDDQALAEQIQRVERAVVKAGA